MIIFRCRVLFCLLAIGVGACSSETAQQNFVVSADTPEDFPNILEFDENKAESRGSDMQSVMDQANMTVESMDREAATSRRNADLRRDMEIEELHQKVETLEQRQSLDRADR